MPVSGMHAGFSQAPISGLVPRRDSAVGHHRNRTMARDARHLRCALSRHLRSALSRRQHRCTDWNLTDGRCRQRREGLHRYSPAYPPSPPDIRIMKFYPPVRVSLVPRGPFGDIAQVDLSPLRCVLELIPHNVVQQKRHVIHDVESGAVPGCVVHNRVVDECRSRHVFARGSQIRGFAGVSPDRYSATQIACMVVTYEVVVEQFPGIIVQGT